MTVTLVKGLPIQDEVKKLARLLKTLAEYKCHEFARSCFNRVERGDAMPTGHHADSFDRFWWLAKASVVTSGDEPRSINND
ncbi:hypothetical protein ABID08_006646 [Rhizobium binae]|uniref:Uncharacterized protein n=2 Tax=Rhizobium/Agrobacterium group TaxID=227290 RepID=A0ABV2MS20_9HYPH